jgi:hypothetical protein
VVENLLELTATYNRSFGEHRFSVLGGYSYQENTGENSYMSNSNFPTDLFTYNNMGSGDALRQGRANMFSDKGRWNLVGFYGRLTYNYKEKYCC